MENDKPANQEIKNKTEKKSDRPNTLPSKHIDVDNSVPDVDSPLMGESVEEMESRFMVSKGYDPEEITFDEFLIECSPLDEDVADFLNLVHARKMAKKNMRNDLKAADRQKDLDNLWKTDPETASKKYKEPLYQSPFGTVEKAQKYIVTGKLPDGSTGTLERGIDRLQAVSDASEKQASGPSAYAGYAHDATKYFSGEAYEKDKDIYDYFKSQNLMKELLKKNPKPVETAVSNMVGASDKGKSPKSKENKDASVDGYGVNPGAAI
jgi:hypothetical protein